MKRPHHMTMKELTALPVVGERELSWQVSMPNHGSSYDIYGAAFEDHEGFAWGTVLRSGHWHRYPLRPSVSRHRGISIPGLKALLTSSLAPVRLSA